MIFDRNYVNADEVTFASQKINISGIEYLTTAIASSDILSEATSDQWRLTCRYLVDAQQDASVISYSLPSYRTSSLSIPVFIPRLRVTFDRSQTTRFGAEWPDGNYAYMTSYTNMLVSIKIFGAFSSVSNCS